MASDEAVTPVAHDVALADRYAALGLLRAARAVYERAAAAAPSAATRSRLVAACLAQGDGPAARAAAEALWAIDRGPAARLLIARAKLAVHEIAAARRSFAGVCEAATATAGQLAEAHLGLCHVSRAEGDSGGAGAHAMAAWDAVIAIAIAGDLDPAALALADSAAGALCACGRGDDAAEAIAQARAEPAAMIEVLAAVLAHHRGEVAGNLAPPDGGLPAPVARAARELFAGHCLGRGRRGAAAPAISDLAALEADLATAADADPAQLCRVRFALACALEADPQSSAEAAALYCQVLAEVPGHAAAASNLAQLALAAGDPEAALSACAEALRASPHSESAWLAVARALSFLPAGTAAGHLATLLAAAAPGLGGAVAEPATRLYHATASAAREAVLAGVHARGHRMKNAVGIIGARVRAATRQATAENPASELATKLGAIAAEVTSIYDEWARYLRSVEATQPVFETVAIAALVHRVVAEIPAPTPVEVTIPDGDIPGVRGDRLLLGEAIHNLVANAVDASQETGGAVKVRVRYRATSPTAAIEIEIADTGPGIAAADLAHIFAPGFTTKAAGSGIGLAVVDRVATAHRGRVLVDSAPGQGTTMTLVLPCAGQWSGGGA